MSILTTKANLLANLAEMYRQIEGICLKYDLYPEITIEEFPVFQGNYWSVLLYAKNEIQNFLVVGLQVNSDSISGQIPNGEKFQEIDSQSLDMLLQAKGLTPAVEA